ncbi:myb family transcription factor PHL8-like [Arachis stenosperma]|uniref:myb family transcription factor PHL8-like n=1 Tax=Arachis stenosperma TaxID=217475 RepID=UPI0025AC7AEC|nr:myb family transcription factor PHL8-like [Arachis stenosperma]
MLHHINSNSSTKQRKRKRKMEMDMEKMQNQSVHFVLSTDAKPRLKWTPELHQRFTEAVHQLGGAEKATPKSLMRVMGIQGLTLYHLKSHLQKYRLGKSHQLETCSDNQQEDCRKIKSSHGHCSKENSVGEQKQVTENMKIAQALHMQMEVQRKLCEQIEVQKHLQLRIEAQGKYLQSVLKKAQEALQGYNSSSIGLELTKAELSQLVTVINNACPGSPISELTETRGLSLRSDDERKQDKGTMCSLESSLTSSESCGRKEEIHQPMEEETRWNLKSFNEISLEFPFEAFHQTGKGQSGDDSSKEERVRKRNVKTDSEGSYCVEQPSGKRCGNKLRKLEFDLNNQYHNDTDSR